MNRLGIVIDLSESSYQTQIDVLSNTSTPVIFSRGAAAAICNNSRNIQDNILEALVRQPFKFSLLRSKQLANQ